MAFNFPASVAACLAAAQGFKVPRQLAMYCIAQDAGAPYMLYKDNMERTAVGGGGGGMPMSMHQGGGPLANGGALVGAPATWGGAPHPSVENGAVLSPPGGGSYPVTGTPSSPSDSLIQQNGDSPGSTPASVTVTVQTNQQQDQQHSITPPVPSPAYADQAAQQTINATQQVNGEDESSVVVNVGSQNQPAHSHSPAIQQQQQQQSDSDPDRQPSSAAAVCFPDAAYYRGGHGGGPPPPPPPHMLTTNSFMTYLKQQHQHQQQQQQHNQQHNQQNQQQQQQQQGVVMLTQLQAADPGADFAASMPDLLAAQQNAKLNSKGVGGAHSDLRLFKCVTCGKDFKQKSTLLQHERIHTDSRPYPCGECGKRFRQQSHLTQHLRIHANEKPFACVYCERTFRQRAILNQHLRIHSGEKPFACSQCGKRFRQKAILNQHVRTHQGEHSTNDAFSLLPHFVRCSSSPSHSPPPSPLQAHLEITMSCPPSPPAGSNTLDAEELDSIRTPLDSATETDIKSVDSELGDICHQNPLKIEEKYIKCVDIRELGDIRGLQNPLKIEEREIKDFDEIRLQNPLKTAEKVIKGEDNRELGNIRSQTPLKMKERYIKEEDSGNMASKNI